MDNDVRKLLEEYNTEFVKFRRDVEDALENIDLDNLTPRVRSFITENGTAKAGFETGSVSDGAYARMFAEFKNAQEKSLAEFKAEVASTYATAEMLSQYETSTNQAIASIQTTASENGAGIQTLTEWKNSFYGENGEYQKDRKAQQESLKALNSFVETQTEANAAFAKTEDITVWRGTKYTSFEDGLNAAESAAETAANSYTDGKISEATTNIEAKVYTKTQADSEFAKSETLTAYKAEVTKKFSDAQKEANEYTDDKFGKVKTDILSQVYSKTEATEQFAGKSDLSEYTTKTAFSGYKTETDQSLQDIETDLAKTETSIAGIMQKANASGAFIGMFATAGSGSLKKDKNGNYVTTEDGEYIFVKDGEETPISQADVSGMFISKLNGGSSQIKLNADKISFGNYASVDNEGNLKVKRVYSDGSNGFYFKISTVGDTGIYQMSAEDNADPSSPDCAFGVRHDISNAINFYCYGDNFGGYNYNQDKFFPKGTWDFSSAAVTGLADSLTGLAVYFS